MYKSTSMELPQSYYWEGLDNFFTKLTAMESPRKNNDCYFYYYSTCTKGDSCTFRHEPSALGCETMCSYWQHGKCLNQHCNFRHMELRKNRKAIPCYWETQPSGCRKLHCPFRHKKPRVLPNTGPSLDSTEDSNEGTSVQIERADWNRRQVVDNNQYDQPTAANLPSENECSRSDGKGLDEDKAKLASVSVDPLVVNFEEESDNESASTTPVKSASRTHSVHVKTLEEIRLEKIQAESAAYYSYSPTSTELNLSLQQNNGDDLRRILANRTTVRSLYKKINTETSAINILTLSEIRKRKRQPSIEGSVSLDNDNIDVDDVTNSSRKIKLQTQKPVDDIKIKTLDEIRAERSKRTCDDNSDIFYVSETFNNNNNADKKQNIPLKLKRSLSSDSSTEMSLCKRREIRQNSNNSSDSSSFVESTVHIEVPDIVILEPNDYMVCDSTTNNKQNAPDQSGIDNSVSVDCSCSNNLEINDDIIDEIDELLDD